MPIISKLDYLLEVNQTTLTELAEKVNITIANLSVLKRGKSRAIRFSTLEAICRELNCKPGDILDYTENNDKSIKH